MPAIKDTIELTDEEQQLFKQLLDATKQARRLCCCCCRCCFACAAADPAAVSVLSAQAGLPS
jgi:hypothetical protein